MAKKSAMKQSFFLFFLDNNQKIFRSNLVLEVVFVPESEGLYYLAVADPGEPVHPQLVVQLKYTRIASVSCFL